MCGGFPGCCCVYEWDDHFDSALSGRYGTYINTQRVRKTNYTQAGTIARRNYDQLADIGICWNYPPDLGATWLFWTEFLLSAEHVPGTFVGNGEEIDGDDVTIWASADNWYTILTNNDLAYACNFPLANNVVFESRITDSLGNDIFPQASDLIRFEVEKITATNHTFQLFINGNPTYYDFGSGTTLLKTTFDPTALGPVDLKDFERHERFIATRTRTIDRMALGWTDPEEVVEQPPPEPPPL